MSNFRGQYLTMFPSNFYIYFWLAEPNKYQKVTFLVFLHLIFPSQFNIQVLCLYFTYSEQRYFKMVQVGYLYLFHHFIAIYYMKHFKIYFLNQLRLVVVVLIILIVFSFSIIKTYCLCNIEEATFLDYFRASFSFTNQPNFKCTHWQLVG